MKVVLGLSGGVDSAAAATRLLRDGYDVVGVMCIMHEIGCSAIRDAENVAKNVGIPFDTVDLTERFEQTVVGDFIAKYRAGRTPNPCVVCNPNVKFKALCDYADNIGAEKIATGHYAGIFSENGRFCAVKSVNKDQSYMLCRLTQEQLSRTVFPLFNTCKPDIRNEVKDAGLDVYLKKDSQEICFIPENDHAAFIESRIGRLEEGDFVLNGKVVGRHKGIERYTVGQSKKLGIALGFPVYIREIDAKNNRILLSGEDVTDFRELECENAVFQLLDEHFDTVKADVKIRYAHKGASATVENHGNGKLKITFDEPQRAVTSGQYAVAYRDGKILCSGEIL